jgi:hypothetical protein
MKIILQGLSPSPYIFCQNLLLIEVSFGPPHFQVEKSGARISPGSTFILREGSELTGTYHVL